MERVWDELKKIEAEAEQIRTDAQEQAKNMTNLSQQQAEKLVANSEDYAAEEAQQLYQKTVDDANHSRDEQLKLNQDATDKLKMQAEKRMDSAVLKVVNSVLEEA